MALRESRITLVDGGNELTFVVKQMTASQTVDFLGKLVLLIGRSDIKMSDFNVDNISEMDQGQQLQFAINVIFEKGLRCLSGLSYENDLKPLMEDLLKCCSRLVDGYSQACTWNTLDAFISEAKTILLLEKESIRVNFNFFGEGQESPLNSHDLMNIGKPRKQKV